MHIKYYYWTVGVLLTALAIILFIFGFTVYNDFQKVIAEKEEERLEEEEEEKKIGNKKRY
ncbi:hypothetical protein [Saliterribacillus persicus]|uniref:Uncharacterized protein n=1 Tax=Saliterribacillus persicus TaxID=930114 RepID=A0A368X9N4_9BACI|nr:hypothetical protein [Saliterribacillus persicus]RCW64555.1 hypothetical protein DFR57_11339 [Saliterribacillus persicus]